MNGSPKYRRVFESLSSDILEGKYAPGQKLPGEAALVKRFGTSRITVGRAVRDLRERGLVERIAGSGTYVKAARPAPGGMIFGLLMPDLGETEIFEPICQGMAGAPKITQHALLLGQMEGGRASRAEQALQLCRQYIARSVSGVFFAPLELTPEHDRINRAIVSEFDKARVPVVLLDRCILPFPKRSRYDLVGIDNRRAGYEITEHLLKLGCRRIAFLNCSRGASTIDARIAGYREALLAYDIVPEPGFIQRLAAVAEAGVRQMMERLQPEAFVCANDRTAGRLMHALIALGYRIPRDVRIVGIDDVEYAGLLPVSLTTIHQPCREIGEAAVTAMLERIERPGMLARDILLECRLVVRESCGTRLTAAC